MQTPSSLYGVLAEFSTPDELLAATRGARQAGYRQMDAYTPFPVEGLAEALGFQRTGLPFLVLLGGIVGGGARHARPQWVTDALSSPLQCAAFRTGDSQRLFLMYRGQRSQIRPRRD